jgi:hypothetical protein
MNPVVESALISGAATIVSVGGTVAVAIVGFRHSSSTTDKAVEAARSTNKETLDATRKGQIADLYSRAIDQLGSKMLDARIGGIYALERVAQDSAADHPTVMEVLGAFIREHSHEGWPTPATDQPRADVLDHTTRPDVQAALTVIGHGDRGQDRRPIDLARADLTGADLTRADLTDANLSKATFTGANLSDANLTEKANLRDADLTGANLSGANLSGANLRGADLTGATLNHATLKDVDLRGANLTGAKLIAAILAGALLYGADFTNAHLDSAKLVGAHLTGGHLTGGKRLVGPDFTSAYLAGATWPEETPPKGWNRDPSTGQLWSANADANDSGN